MLTLIDGENRTVLDRVYSARAPEFAECRHWFVVFDESEPDAYTIYGLGFDPFVLDDVCEQGEDWPWPTNELFHRVANALCKESYEHWKIVSVVA